MLVERVANITALRFVVVHAIGIAVHIGNVAGGELFPVHFLNGLLHRQTALSAVGIRGVCFMMLIYIARKNIIAFPVGIYIYLIRGVFGDITVHDSSRFTPPFIGVMTGTIFSPTKAIEIFTYVFHLARSTATKSQKVIFRITTARESIFASIRWFIVRRRRDFFVTPIIPSVQVRASLPASTSIVTAGVSLMAEERIPRTPIVGPIVTVVLTGAGSYIFTPGKRGKIFRISSSAAVAVVVATIQATTAAVVALLTAIIIITPRLVVGQGRQFQLRRILTTALLPNLSRREPPGRTAFLLHARTHNVEKYREGEADEQCFLGHGGGHGPAAVVAMVVSLTAVGGVGGQASACEGVG
mmetsp:Transcript_16820/g.30495  ORF Transcript_16820/g.30495 Transcript_16820/m.30495 type:complete len:356 (-) Transcript_16820:99-1166(-)